MGFPPAVGLRVLLQDAKGDLLKTAFFTPPASSGKKINIGGDFFFNVTKGNSQFSAPN